MRFKAAVLERVGAPLVVRRSSYDGPRPRRDFPWQAQLYLDGRLKLDELITRRISLGEINDGFAAMTRGEVVRTVVMF
jgi:S-(hydroxymethyl)glutathione dehydrogenase/alcohol dehydrogenase